ncbi:hypothetical protein M409DRAFT_28460 [Zasmidium cellare ATCC 36951]|uniref:Coenzyme Q-binding protein COQ10 START domain-containing protein n=1 Tax=Zasmidium cellare ATCC 36951 TaxID=1080233 RepID=A0A6A6C4M2_ZASCE|nr:uncharacterized protein M409DRAFT_28460 [Zasmidium cellare ATCC 36951]KAF2161130.1 hypothetical protein M409DRAFT_28460 [Zasmidium cellare ATCC 36951]
MAKLLQTPTATPSQSAETIVFTSGSSIRISRPASAVFSTILNTKSYSAWNTSNPRVTFPDSERGGEAEPESWTTGASGILQFHMAAPSSSSSATQVPVKVLSVREDPAQGEYRLEWQGQMLPRWFGMAERVQSVRAVGEEECELVQWESMSGWGVYVLDWVLGIRKQMDKVNLRYAEDLKMYSER